MEASFPGAYHRLAGSASAGAPHGESRTHEQTQSCPASSWPRTTTSPRTSSAPRHWSAWPGRTAPGLIALPEMFQYRGPVAGFRESASELPGPVTDQFSELARDLDCWILLGSLAERSADPMRPYNTSVLLDPAGRSPPCTGSATCST